MHWIILALVVLCSSMFNRVLALEGEHIVGCTFGFGFAYPYGTLIYHCAHKSGFWNIANDVLRCTNANIYRRDIKTIFFDNNCKLSKFPKDILNNFENVRSINLNHNALESVDSADLNEFNGTVHGESFVLNLEYNNIKRVNVNSVHGTITKVQILTLQGNKLEKLIAHGLSGFANLERLYLQSNQIGEIEMFAFEGLNRLTALCLSFNRIAQISDSTFPNPSKLTKLLLSFNHISEISPFAFSNLTNLLILDLSHNNISDMKNETLTPMVNLLKLSLSSNKLQKIDFVPELKHLRTLYVDGNRLLAEIPANIDELFPNLKEMCITNINFNCTYADSLLWSLGDFIKFIGGVDCTNPGGSTNEELKISVTEETFV